MQESLWATATVAFATFFATIGPLDVAAMFAALTPRVHVSRKRSIAKRGVLVAAAILFLFALVGEALLSSFGISLAALRTAGGILLLLIGIEMVFARTSGATTTTDDEAKEAQEKTDIAIFPIATPLIAGPGAIGAVILLMAGAKESYLHQGVVLLALILNLGITWLCLLMAGQIQRFFGVTGMHVVTRVLGIILTALAVQFVFDGVADSGIFKPHS